MTDCQCICHIGGYDRPACDVVGGCGANHTASRQVDGPICPGPCNNRYRKAAVLEQETGEKNELRPKLGSPVWCVDRQDKDGAEISCSHNVGRAISAMPELYVHLHMSKAVKTADKHDRHGTGDAASPSPEVDDQDETVRWLWDWEQTIRAERQLSGVDDFPETETWERILTDAVRFLSTHLEWALTKMDPGLVEDFGMDMLNEHRRLTRTTKTGEVMQHRPVPCPRCQRKTLVHELGTRHVACTNKDCGRLMTLDEYDEYATMLSKSRAKTPAA